MPHPLSVKPAPVPVNVRDREVAAFLSERRPRAALKCLMRLKTAATADDLVTVVTVLAQTPAFETSRLLLDTVLDCAQGNDRLEPSHKAALRAALEGKNFAHPALIGEVTDRISHQLLERPEPTPARTKKARTGNKLTMTPPFGGNVTVDVDARTFPS